MQIPTPELGDGLVDGDTQSLSVSEGLVSHTTTEGQFTPVSASAPAGNQEAREYPQLSLFLQGEHAPAPAGDPQQGQDPQQQEETAPDAARDPEPGQDSQLLQGEPAPVPALDHQPNED